MREHAHKDAIELAIERWNAHDERYFEFYADEAPIHGFPGIPETVEGEGALPPDVDEFPGQSGRAHSRCG
jgi:hypothetical protein